MPVPVPATGLRFKQGRREEHRDRGIKKKKLPQSRKSPTHGAVGGDCGAASNERTGANGLGVDEKLKGTKHVLHRRINFVGATRAQNGDVIGQMLNRTAAAGPEVNGKAEDQGDDELEEVENPLYPRNRIKKLLQWREVRKVGPGLANLGNTCFCNSVLQCLAYTPPLANFCLNGEHTKRGRASGAGSSGFDAFAAIERHITSVLTEKRKVAKPSGIVSSLKKIGSHFRLGRQEDAHEFARLLMEGMLKADLEAVKVKVSPYSRIAHTGVVHSMFGGHLRSQIRCGTCNYKSNTFDAFLDLSLEVNKADSIERALQKFTAIETLDGQNKYRCSRCKTKVRAQKRFTVHRAPFVLTLHLKRFENSMGKGGKITRYIKFTDTLDLSSFMSEGKSTEAPPYQLYAVLVHSGHSTRSGHYFAFIKNSNGVWYEMDDDQVRQVSLTTVLRQRAYMLFYTQPPSGGSIMPPSPALAGRAGTSPLLRAQAPLLDSSCSALAGLDGFSLLGSLAPKNTNSESESEGSSSESDEEVSFRGARAKNERSLSSVDKYDDDSSDDDFEPPDQRDDDDDDDDDDDEDSDWSLSKDTKREKVKIGGHGGGSSGDSDTSEEEGSEDEDEGVGGEGSSEQVSEDEAQVGQSSKDMQEEILQRRLFGASGVRLHMGAPLRYLITTFGRSWFFNCTRVRALNLRSIGRAAGKRRVRTHDSHNTKSSSSSDGEALDEHGYNKKREDPARQGTQGDFAQTRGLQHSDASSERGQRSTGKANMKPSDAELQQVFGLNVHSHCGSQGTWDVGESIKGADTQKKLLRTKEMRGTKRLRDDWNDEYDKGKTKKLREKKVMQAMSASKNPFQKVAESKQATKRA